MLKNNLKKVVFLSHAINTRTPLYGGEKSILIKEVKSLKRGDSCNKMYFSFPSHTGTHVDTFLHFINGGLSITDFTAAEWLFRRVSLVEIKNTRPGYIISKEDFLSLVDCDLLLIRTGFERYRNKQIYWKNSPGLDSDLAGYLKAKCPALRAIGTDFISISNLQKPVLGQEAHQSFFNKGILLIEDMKLSGLKKKPNLVIVAPLLVRGAEASPCTVMGICH